MIPKIIFKYSWIYDEHWKELAKDNNYPKANEILKYIKKVEKLWKKNEKKILDELSNISKLQWKSEIINCYVVGQCIPFSNPLTLPIYEKETYFIDVLIHELIHQLFIQNEDIQKPWKYIDLKYKTESRKTRNHIPLYAIHYHIYLKFFEEERLNINIKRISSKPDYKKAWEIVKKEGYKKIIKEFTNLI